MSPNTTLITFRVRAPPTARTLKLYGSWDNFTTSYPMNKDLQIGSEYWHGCFNFSNIICDGKPADTIESRSGGLKMGGTYWFYYKVDDEVDFHNVCERATTNCPLLPGQLVNVLHVPYALSGNRSRNPSTSSTSSERRTMNPQDKFMNPRPAPSKPEMVRVNTSPTTNDFGPVLDDAQTSTPPKDTPNPPRFLRLAKKGSMDSYVTGSSSTALGGGLRAAFRLRTARSQSPDAKSGTDDHQHRRAASSERRYDAEINKGINDALTKPQRGLLFRAASEETVPTLSFDQHRRQRSASREAPSTRGLISREQSRHIENLTLVHSIHQPLSTLSEASPSRIQATDDAEEDPSRIEPNLEKRLPTLPNTPSSAYPASINEHSPPRRVPLDLDHLESHFSSTTIDTEPHLMSVAYNERSHFSAWTTTTDTSSIFVDTSVPLPTTSNRRLSFTALPPSQNGDQSDATQPSFLTFSCDTSSISTTPSTSFLDVDAEFEAAQLSMGYAPQIPHYTLPECEFSSQTTLKALSQEPFRGRSRTASTEGLGHQPTANAEGSEIVHSESMQRLLDELSYLSDMIRH